MGFLNFIIMFHLSYSFNASFEFKENRVRIIFYNIAVISPNGSSSGVFPSSHYEPIKKDIFIIIENYQNTLLKSLKKDF